MNIDPPYSGWAYIRLTRGVRGLRPHAIVECNCSNPAERRVAGELLDANAVLLPAGAPLDVDPIPAGSIGRDGFKSQRSEREPVPLPAPARVPLPKWGPVCLRLSRPWRTQRPGTVVHFNLANTDEKQAASDLVDRGAAEVVHEPSDVSASRVLAQTSPDAPGTPLSRPFHDPRSAMPDAAPSVLSRLSPAERAEVVAEVVAELDARAASRGAA